MSSPVLKYSPYTIFKGSRTPPGLYARQKWLNQGETESYKTDFDATVAELLSVGEGPSNRSERILETLHRLFGLHLTVRNPNPFIEAALSDLITENRVRPQKNEMMLVPDQIRGLPFAPSRWRFFIGPAALFLSAIFGKATAPLVNQLYAQLAADVVESAEFQSDAAAMHNALRALVVHPDDRFRPAIRSVVSWFAARQTARGDWGPNIPFFQADNALAHLNILAADAQFDKALTPIINSQNTDGTWDSADQEWQTFLVVHALRNKGILGSSQDVA
jgi:hypothetical protein